MRCGTVIINQFNGRKIIGTVGQLQFEVIQYRLENDIMQNADGSLSAYTRHVGWKVMTRKNWKLYKKRKYQYMAKDREGRDVFLADSNYVLQMAQMDFKHIKFHFTSEF